MDFESDTVRFPTVPTPEQKPFPFRLEFPPDLPISARAGEIMETLRAHPVVILAGETGSGKTTQIPKLCLAAGGGRAGRIACTQPRRVAALSVSRRVAEELGVNWGREVGCKVRFDDRTSRDTVIKFLTDGMLLAEVQSDPLLRAYDTIIIDEAHERSLNIDFLLGHLRTLRYKRPELRIVITSATIDTAAFSAAFDGAPVIEVSGRTFPVEVIYAPLDGLGSDAAEDDDPSSGAEALHYIDGAVDAVLRILAESTTGDVLVFMPAERDIRETCDLLSGRARGVELVPLFGRLSNAEQQRVFASGGGRKVIVATNIAETSLTIPGIRFVVDTGLARISRYVPQGRTRRLPIEAVAQSSADQRKGRAGRVAAGVCVRLYSEKDYETRPRFTQPEIQRANLADVILRLKAFGLGDIERFPFINMPAAKAIRAGYGLLEEVGAITAGNNADNRELTAIGRELARLPVDPTVGRMILQAREEKALREVLVIAAGLSIQDPRERPLEKQAAADAAHRRFAHPDSDFLTLLNIWEAFHDEFERLSQGKLRRFCRDHFLSYTRLREWRDIHAQLADTIAGRNDLRESSVWEGASAEARAHEKLLFGSPGYRAIHRSILAGLLGNVAARDDERGGYKATHSRKVSVFPGSALFVRDDKNRPRGNSPKAKEAAARADRGARWIVAAEIMETTRLYARTCARLDPAWALDLGSHVTAVAHSEPFWDEARGRVMVRQRTRLYGLELESKAVGYGAIDPEDATDIFIREALVNDTITQPIETLVHNRAVRERVAAELTRRRDSGLLNLEEMVYRFYASVLLGDGGATLPHGPVSAVPELARLLRDRVASQPDFLRLEESMLRPPAEEQVDPAAFPPSVPIDNRVLPLVYVYRPGGDDDGVTLEVNVREADDLTPTALDWAVPGHLAAKVEHYLRALPKDLRREIMPFAASARQMTQDVAARDRLSGRRETLREALAARLGERFGLNIKPSLWDERPLPDHLTVRVKVVDDAGREIASSRNLDVIKSALREHERKLGAAAPRRESAAWREARAKWEVADLEGWPERDLPASILVEEQAGVPVRAYPALRSSSGNVGVVLARSEEVAAAWHAAGLQRLLAIALRYELAWFENDLKGLRAVGPIAASFTTVEQMQRDALASVSAWVIDPTRVEGGGRTKAGFDAAVTRGKRELRGMVLRLTDLLKQVLSLRQSLLVHPTPYEGLVQDVDALLPADFLARIPFARLEHVPRYLQARLARAERWKQNPPKDAERGKELARWLKAAEKVEDGAAAQRVRWLIEEYRVSLFAQEIGTAEAVSPKKLEEALAGSATPPVDEARTAARARKPAPLPITPAGPKKTLKSLNALDALFKR